MAQIIGAGMMARAGCKGGPKMVVPKAVSPGGEKHLLPGEGRVADFRKLHTMRVKGDNLTPNHMPQAASMQSHGVKKSDG